MHEVTVKSKEYQGWKNCIEISNGIVDAVATTDIGPRVIRFGFVDNVNEFLENRDQVGLTGDTEWKLYGGHRLWHSPEDVVRTYIPDNSKIEWEEKKNGISLIQPVEKQTQIKKEIHLTLYNNEPKVKVVHKLKNEGLWPVHMSAWAITVMSQGGKEIIPLPSRNTSPLPNSMISLWPYTKMNDTRVSWGENHIILSQDTNASRAFKIGITNEDGWAAYINNGHMFVKLHHHIDTVVYPDYASSYETYTDQQILEMETLSPLVTVAPGGCIEHTETWYLYDHIKVPRNEEEIEKNILPLIKKVLQS